MMNLRFARVVAGFVEDFVCGDGAQALVDEVDGNGRAGAQVVGELLDFRGPRALVAGKMEWVADDHFGNFMPANEAKQ